MNRITRKQRRAVLKSADCAQSNIRIEVLQGIALAPALAGQSFSYVSPAGRPIRYPYAYMRAYGKPRYVASTKRVVVGDIWIQSI